jgi:N-acetylated-alpha-linked acidic dipeptidase
MTYKDPDLERRAHAALDLAEARALIDRFSSLVRESGSADERAAAEYIVGRLEAHRIPVSVYEPELYLSIPERAELRVLEGDGSLVRCRPPAFARSTGGEEVVGEVCYVASRFAEGTADLFDTPLAAVAPGADEDRVAGRVVLTEGYAMPGSVHAFERRGAIAQIYIHPGAAIHEGISTPIWGTPTHESLHRKPRTPIVSIARPDGERLAALARERSLRVGIRTWLREGWWRCALPVAEIEGTEDPDEFVLVHGHYDSWYVGVGDNATGDAALLEIARILHGLRHRLKRTVRVAWWPGHSTGRYAGSTWYADTFAAEIDEWLVAHINVDSPGCRDATAYEEVMWMAEAAALCLEAIADAVGARARGLRPLRAGDYAFNQIGATGCYMLLSNIPRAEREARGYYAVGGCGGSPVWHTPEDGPAVADLDILRRDLQIYLTTILRVANAPLHPFDYAATVDEIAAAVARYRDLAAGAVDFDPIIDDLRRLREAISRWRAEAERRVVEEGYDPEVRRALNATLRRLARWLVPLAYARGERFDHDPAVKLPAVPRLEAAALVASAPGELQPFVRTALVREMNKVRAILRAARRELRSPA